MANYTATLDASARKTHTCVACGAVFAYVFKRTVTGTGGSQEAAKTALGESLVSTMNEAVDTHPCPTCGMVQPEMVGAERSGSHTAQAIVAGLALPVLALVAGTHAAHLSTVTMAAACLYGAVGAWAYRTAAHNPNQSRVPGTDAGVEVLEAGDAERSQSGDPARATDGAHPASFGFLAAAVVLCLTPGLLRVVRGSAWNARCYPAVVGPGDTTTYYFDQEITSIKGMWRGKAAAALVGLEGLGEDGVLVCEATTKDRDWGSTIRAKSSEKAQSSSIYAEIQIPEDPALAGRTAELVARIAFQYPQMGAGGGFDVKGDRIEERVPLTLAAPGAGQAYSRASWVGIVLGGVLLLVGCLWLRRRAGALDGNPRGTAAVA